jgi:uncharacterized protein YdeI (YjbR/CyaY-like superfamily)
MKVAGAKRGAPPAPAMSAKHGRAGSVDGLAAPAKRLDGTPSLYARDAKTWRTWLERNHATAERLWLVFYKKASSFKCISYEDALQEALCFGWIDSKVIRRDEDSRMQMFSPRRPRSVWSQPNKDRIAVLTAAGRMAAAGLEVVAQAKTSGAWSAEDAAWALTVPDDLATELAARPPARANFDAFSTSVKRKLLRWLLSAKRAETRTARLTQVAEMAQKNLRATYDTD